MSGHQNKTMNTNASRSFLRKTLFGLSLFVPVLTSSNIADAAYNNIRFNGAISNSGSCQINVVRNGALGVATNLRTLSSKIAGGLTGNVILRTTGIYKLSVDTPAVFAVSPLGGDTGVTRTASFFGYDMNSSATFSERTAPIFANGSNMRTNMSIHFVASRPTVFPGGHYEALTIVRCEPA